MLPFRNYLSNQKYQFYQELQKYIDNDSFALIAGTMFGDTSYMDDDDYSMFKKSGLSHILAVSGLHVNLAYSAIFVLLNRKRNIKNDLICILFILAYAALSNYSISVIRASLMILCRIIAFYLDRPYDSVSCISAIASIILILNPNMVFDSGLQLSFAASFTMSIAYPWARVKLAKFCDKIKKDWIYKVLSIFLPSFVALAGTGPLICYHFLSFSPVSLFLNPLAICIAGFLLPLSLALFASFIILPKILSSWVLFVFGDVAAVLSKLISLVGKIGNFIYPNNDICAPPLSGLILYYILFFFFFSEFRYVLHRKRNYKQLLATYLVAIILGLIFPKVMNITSTIIPWDYGLSDIVFLDVGQGDSIFLNINGYQVLIDGGGKYSSNIAESVLKPFLLKNGIKKLDLAIITHMDMDHSKGIQELQEIYDIDKVLSNHDIYGDIDDENSQCLICEFNINGLDLLLMSDADLNREEKLVTNNPNLSCDIIKIAHHGSANSTSYAFIKAVKPSFATISVGANNNYGHPSERVIELLTNSGIIYGRTDIYGALCLKKVNAKYFVFENAAKDQEWLIQRDQKNILLEQ